MLVAAYILSLGSQLMVAKDTTDIPLPGGLIFDHVPLLDNALAVRFSFYASICAAVILGIGLDRMHRAAHGSARWRSLGTPIAIAFLALVPLIPAHAYSVTEVHQPAFFSSSTVDSIPAESVTVIYPFPSPATPQGMLWQAQAGMRFKMAGAYALVPAPVTDEATFNQPSFTNLVFSKIHEGTPVQRTRALRTQLRNEWGSWRVQTIVASRAAAHSAEAQSFVKWVLNRRPTRTQGVAVWHGVTSEGA